MRVSLQWFQALEALEESPFVVGEPNIPVCNAQLGLSLLDASPLPLENCTQVFRLPVSLLSLRCIRMSR
jgi:hypothetical protein